jgi:cellobiose dehydrogenase (acceptor)
VTNQATPETTEILATVQAPGSLGWVAFGFGEEMSGSLMFVLWADNTNIVVSSRYGTYFPESFALVLTLVSGHSEPSVYSGPTITVLSSTITSSQFNAQLQLSNATTWVNSGTLDISSSDAGVIWAYGDNPPSNPSDPSSDFQQHSAQGTFSIDMKSAQVSQQNSSPASASSTNTTGTTDDPKTGTNAIQPPQIIGNSSSHNTQGGLSYRDKVFFQWGRVNW